MYIQIMFAGVVLTTPSISVCSCCCHNYHSINKMANNNTKRHCRTNNKSRQFILNNCKSNNKMLGERMCRQQQQQMTGKNIYLYSVYLCIPVAGDNNSQSQCNNSNAICIYKPKSNNNNNNFKIASDDDNNNKNICKMLFDSSIATACTYLCHLLPMSNLWLNFFNKNNKSQSTPGTFVNIGVLPKYF